MESKPYFFMKSIEVPIYTGRLIIVLTNDDKELIKRKLPLSDYTPPFAYAQHLFWRGRETYAIILNVTDDQFSWGIVAHEVFHVADHIMQNIQHVKSPDGEEYAYLIGWVTNQVVALIRKHKETLGLPEYLLN